MTMMLQCAKCGGAHDVAQFSWGFDHPDQWDLLSEAERKASELGQEQCVIEKDGTHFFIRACLELPIKGREEPFVWGVWCSLSEKNFLEVSEHWEDSKRTQVGPHFGWLSSRLPGYPDTMFMKTMVHQRDVGVRPFVELERTDHLLSVHQHEGIDPAQLMTIIAELVHHDAQPSV